MNPNVPSGTPEYGPFLDEVDQFALRSHEGESLSADHELESDPSWADFEPLLAEKLEESLGLTYEEFLGIDDAGAMMGVLYQLEDFDEIEEALSESGLVDEFYE